MSDWLVIHVRLREGEIWLEYEDSSEFHWPSPGESGEAARLHSELLAVRGWKVRVPAGFAERIAESIRDAPTPQSLLPIFARSVAFAGAETFIAEVISAIGCDVAKVQVVALARERWDVIRPFRPPLQIAFETPSSLRSVWFSEGVIDVVTTSSELGPPDILMVDRTGGDRVEQVLGMPLDELPHLIVTFDRAVSGRRGLQRTSELPPGVSLLSASGVTGEDQARVVERIVDGILNDQPLHEVVASANRSGLPLSLFSDPLANHSFRLSDALLGHYEEAKQLRDLLAFDVAGTEKLLAQRQRGRGRRRGPDGAASETMPPDALSGFDNRGEVDNESLRTPGKAFRSMSRMRGVPDRVADLHARSKSDSALDQAMYPREERRLDVALLRRDFIGEASLFVPPESTLRVNGRYRLRVQIGAPIPESIMVGDVPAIDAFLPPPSEKAGHLLTVVLYPLDFRSSSSTSHLLFLPPRGPSAVVYFDVRAPKTPAVASMRIAVYYELPPGQLAEDDAHDRYRNQLVQSFIVRAEIAGAEVERSEPVTTARLDVCQRAQFTRIESLQPRLASLGFQEMVPHGHAFMVKGRTVHGCTTLTTEAMTASLKTVRSILNKASRDENGNPRFPETDVADRGEWREAAFDDAVRKLARSGYDIYHNLYGDLPDAQQEVLDEISAAHDETIQIVRFNSKYLFPWSFLYDFALPLEKPDEPEATVCKGFLRETHGKPISCGHCLADCLYPRKSDAFCVWGFWGFRHSVEQVLHAPDKKEDTIEEVRPVPERAVGVSIGTKGVYANVLVAALQEIVGTGGVLDVVPPINLVETLAANDTRPAIMIVLGHYRDDPESGGPAIQIAGDWLMARQVVGLKPKWSDPHPIIVLAACDSASDDLGTLVSFINGFANVRASAVVGTESVVFEGLACRLAKELATVLRDGKTSLGAAILEFRRSLLLLVNPLGLTVTAYGDADLHLAASEQKGI